MVGPEGQRTSELLRVEEHAFVVSVERGIRLEFTVEDGRATSVAKRRVVAGCKGTSGT